MKIIVLERIENVALSYHDKFEELGHKVILLNQGEKLLETIKKEYPQALILGIKIAGFGPYELLEEVRAAFPKLPIIFNTSALEFWEGANDRGADFYFAKTSDLTNLEEIIEKIAKNCQEPPSKKGG
jgi:DNA-binding NtrC family response regulator